MIKRIATITKLLTKRDDLLTKVFFYFAVKSAGPDYDPYEKNWTYSNQNPQTVKMYVREIDAESLVWRNIGVQETGAVEILCEERYKNWFLFANKIVINGDEFEVYKEATGGKVLIQKRPYKIIRVVLRKK
jgi:hypothetical protein